MTNSDIVQQYLHDLGADNLDAVDKNGYTAMMVASSAGHIESVKVLIASFETARKVFMFKKNRQPLSEQLKYKNPNNRSCRKARSNLGLPKRWKRSVSACMDV